MSKTRHPKIRTLSARFSAGHCIDWHVHSWAQLIYATQGVVTVETERSCWVVPSHRGIWVPAGCQHLLRTHGKVFLQTIYLEREHARLGDTTCSAFEIPPLMHELIIHVCKLGIVSGQTLKNRNLIKFLVDQLDDLQPFPLEIPMPRDDRARKLAQLLLSHPGSEKSSSELCKACGSSLRTMQRTFSDELGMPLSRWRNQVKMVTAVQLLGTGRSVTDTAFELGFNSVSAFIFSFRKYFGEPPGKYDARLSR